ncbi:MAG: hypothetical protein RL497_1016 [Pseudomonadota bacterium]|jgi:Fe-S cluster biosynthesis and repair protein YggX
MSRNVFCRKYQTELPGLNTPPNPSPKGLALFENVSQQAWDEWMAHQTRLINEKRLNLMDAAHRKYLSEQMEKFLNNEEIDQADGYVPEQQTK